MRNLREYINNLRENLSSDVQVCFCQPFLPYHRDGIEEDGLATVGFLATVLQDIEDTHQTYQAFFVNRLFRKESLTDVAELIECDETALLHVPDSHAVDAKLIKKLFLGVDLARLLVGHHREDTPSQSAKLSGKRFLTLATLSSRC